MTFRAKLFLKTLLTRTNRMMVIASVILLTLFTFPHAAFAAMPSLNFTVNMSEPVIVNTTGGTPSIALTVDDKPRVATYTSGTGTNALTFTYAPTIGDIDLNGITVNPSIDISLNGGTIKDAAGNNATLSFTPPVTTNVKVSYPALGMDFIYDADGRYTLNGAPYDNLTDLFAHTGGSFTRGSVGTYFDSTGALQTAASNVPRFDYDPTTHAAKGILIEENRTNSLLNSEMSGVTTGTVGSGGIIPSTWIWGSGTGTLTRQVIATGTLSNGMKYIDVRLSGTNSSGATVYPDLYPVTTASCPSASSGQTWTSSAYVAIVSGSASGFVSNPLRFSMSEINAGGSYLTGGSTAISGGSTLTRYIYTRTLTNASTAKACSYFDLSIPNGGTVDITLRIASPQLERGAFPTSYIPTTSATVTRQADLLQLTGLGSILLSNHTASISYEQLFGATTSYYPGILDIDSGSASNRVYIYRDGSIANGISLNNCNSGSCNGLVPGTYTSAAGKVAWAYRSSEIRLVQGGVYKGNVTANVPTTLSRILVGNGDAAMNGTIKQVKIFNTFATDAQLQLLTQ